MGKFYSNEAIGITLSYKNVIIKFKPDFFVFENVKGLWTTKKHRKEYEKIKIELSKNGYVLIRL